MLTKKHFEFLADWIARNTALTAGNPMFAQRNAERQTELTALSLALIAFDGNPRFDRARFEARIAELAGRYV